MEKTGLLYNATEKFNEGWKWFTQKESTKEAQGFHKNQNESLSILKDVKKTQDPALILAVEKSALRVNLIRYANSAEMKSSLETALTELEIAQEALQVVQDPEKYQVLKRALGPKNIQKGLPLDGFRTFETSHRTRLANLLKATGSIPEKSLIRQRIDNLKAAREVYIAMQQKALGMER